MQQNRVNTLRGIEQLLTLGSLNGRWSNLLLNSITIGVFFSLCEKGHANVRFATISFGKNKEMVGLEEQLIQRSVDDV